MTSWVLAIEINLDWLERRLGKDNVTKLLEMLSSTNDNANTNVCIVDPEYETGTCRAGNDSLILDLLASLLDE